MKLDMNAVRELHELDRDKERLDWLDKHELVVHPRGEQWNIRVLAGKLRQAIDEAMKEEP